MTALTLNIPDVVELSDEQFYQICLANRDFRIERSATGELIIMPPTGGITGKCNSDINLELGIWNRQTKLGIVFDSSTGFRLPLGGNRSPDAAWIPREKWDNLAVEEQERFLPLCPDFVVELRSPNDQLKTLQNKMEEYMKNGTRLAWLINRQDREVEIYRYGKKKEIVENPQFLNGEDILPGFELNLALIW